MNKINFYLILFFVVFLTSGCASFGPKKDGYILSKTQIEEDDTDALMLKDIQKDLLSQNYNSAHEKLEVFENKKKFNPYAITVDFLKAWILEGINECPKSIEIYRSILSQTQNKTAAIHATFRMANCYQAVGDLEKALAAYLDSYNNKSYLEIRDGYAIAPSKISNIYAQMGDIKTALEYIEKTNEGIEIIKKIRGEGVSPEWLAEMYFQMGSNLSFKLNLENFESRVQGFRYQQNFLIQSLEFNNSMWSQKALDLLQEQYSLYWNFVENMSDEAFIKNYGVTKEIQKNYMRQILPSIYEAYQRKPDITQTANPFVAQFFNYLDKMEISIGHFLTNDPVYLPLTKEAEELESIKKEVKLEPVHNSQAPTNQHNVESEPHQHDTNQPDNLDKTPEDPNL